MKYCINCGEKLPDKAKFCAFCGDSTELREEAEQKHLPETPEQITPSELKSKIPAQDGIPHLHPGDEYHGYRVIRILNRDSEGVKYIVSKPETGSKQYLLKLFYQSSSENIAKLYSLQMRLQLLKDFDHPHIAPVTEINDSLSPGFIVSEFVDGISLTELKNANPKRLTEDLIRRITTQLVDAATYLRHKGLTMYNLSPVGMILDDNNDIRILISGITYEDVDEREDVFTIGVIAAQLLCHSPFCYSIYSKERLRECKFVYVSDVTVSMNKVVAECLHRNILQRYPTLEGLARELNQLPPISEDQLWELKNGKSDDFDIGSDVVVPKPMKAVDYHFWLLLMVILGVIVTLILIIRRTPPTKNADPTTINSVVDTIRSVNQGRGWNENQANNTPITGYGDTKSSEWIRDRFIQRSGSRTTSSVGLANAGSTPVKTPSRPIGMAFVSSRDFSYGSSDITVSLSSFYIGKHEVTQSEWSKYMRPANVSRRGEDLPVDNITWFEVIEYCNRRSEDENLKQCYSIGGNTKPLDWSRGQISCDWKANGYRLPTEAEWELAALAGTDYPYSGSENLVDVAWYSANSGGRINNGGSKKPNPLGIYDMTGNVSEWCWDWYEANYTLNLRNANDPTGPVTGSLRIIRGGSVFDADLARLNIRNRDRRDPKRGYPFIGFRIVRQG